MKKLVSLILIAVAFCFGAASASAEEIFSNNYAISPYYQHTSIAISELTITSTTAKCVSSVTGNTDTKCITITQTLEKHWAFGLFFGVDGASWKTTSSSKSLTFQNSKTGLSSGTYRVKSVFTVTTKDGQTETVTVYSAEKTIS